MTTPIAPEAPSAYYQAVSGVRLMRLALGAVQRLWPALAVRAACRLFLTPLPPKWLYRGKPWDAQWTLDTLPFETHNLTLYSMAVPGPTVLLVHGWGGHAGQMVPLARALAAAGLRPLIIEMPGHGRSAGWQSTMPQFSRAIDYVSARLLEGGTVVQALVAHSLGASAAAHAAGRALPIDRLVLIAPAASPPAYTRMFAKVFGLSERTRAGMQALIEARAGALMRHFEADVAGPRVAVPTLVVHDIDDSVNRYGDGQAYAASVPGARLLSTSGLGHRAILKDEQTVRAVVDFAVAPTIRRTGDGGCP